MTKTSMLPLSILSRFAITAAGLLLLGGCVTAPSQLQAPSSDAPDIRQVRANAEANLNKSVRWGGTIAGVQNLDGQTRVEVIGRPLLRNGQPDSRQFSQGRFVAVFDEFLDPADYKNNGTLTVVGVVTGTELGKVGEAEYDFPRVQDTAHQLWSSENTRFERRADYGYPGTYAGTYEGLRPYAYHRGYRHYGPRHHRHSVFFDWWVPSLFFSYGYHRGSRLHLHIGN